MYINKTFELRMKALLCVLCCFLCILKIANSSVDLV